MRVVLLAGGFGSRLAEETAVKPKPLVEIGGIPIIEHIMNWYMSFGYNEFIICLGYKGSEIISYFKEYNLRNSTCVISEDGKIETLSTNKKNWKITLAQTGTKTQTAGRLKKISKYLNTNEDFMMTYGDGLADINLNKLEKFHKNKKKLATVTAVRPLARFGAMELKSDNVINFMEKPKTESGWINGGFFVLSYDVLKYINNCMETWESGPIPRIVSKGQLSAFKHEGFWQPMDTLREKQILNDLWLKGNAPWKSFKYNDKNVLNFNTKLLKNVK